MDPENESAELALAYMSIDTMKNRITQLEKENKKLQLEIKAYEKNIDPPWTHSLGNSEEYHNGFNGHGY